MRILQAGNPNFGYVMARELRKRGVEADLLVSRSSMSGTGAYGTPASVNDPMSHDPGAGAYPDWVIFYDIHKRGRALQVSNLLKKYDVIEAYQATPIHAMLSGRPYVAVTGGDELRRKAFERSVTGYLLRRAYRKADRLVYTWPVAKPYVERLGLDGAVFIPRTWDAGRFVRRGSPPGDGPLRIFMPTAQLWDLKGNDKFLRAFARLCAEGRDVFLYCVDWGRDSGRARELLARPECARRTELVPGPVSRDAMAGYMEKSHVLADQFNTGSFTRVGIEAFHFGIPVMVNLDERLYVEAHGDLPSVLQCGTEEEIYGRIEWALGDRGGLGRMGDDSRRWAARHFDLQKNVDRHVELCQEILRR